MSIVNEVIEMLKQRAYLKLLPEQIAVAISLLSEKEKKKLLKLVPDIERFVRFQSLDEIRYRNRNIPLKQASADIKEAIQSVRE